MAETLYRLKKFSDLKLAYVQTCKPEGNRFSWYLIMNVESNINSVVYRNAFVHERIIFSSAMICDVFKMRTLHVWRFQSNYILKLKEVCLCSLLNIWFKSKPMSVLVYILTIECYIGKCKKTSCECEAKQKNRNKRSLFIPYFKMKSNVCQEIVLRYFPVNQHLSLFPLCNHCLTNMEYICKTRQSLQFFFYQMIFFYQIIPNSFKEISVNFYTFYEINFRILL